MGIEDVDIIYGYGYGYGYGWILIWMDGYMDMEDVDIDK